MARTSQLATVLWMSTMTWITGCGRVWFDPAREANRPPSDAPVEDGPLADAAVDGPVDAPVDVAVVAAPRLDIVTARAMLTECGTTPQPVGLTVTNSGNADLQINSATITGDAFLVKAVPTVIAPGAMGQIEIEPPMATVGTDRGGDVKVGRLKIESNAGPAMVDLAATVIGANLVMTPPSPLDYSGTSGRCPVPRQWSVQNTGNSTVTVDPDVGSSFAFTFSSSASTVLGPGDVMNIDVRVITSAACSGSGTVGFLANSSSGAVCQEDIAPLTVNFDIQGSSTSCSCN